jgi:hypothetical protein
MSGAGGVIGKRLICARENKYRRDDAANSMKKTRRGNIESLDGPDPFPRTGLTKQYEPFTRKWVGKFCATRPGAIYEEVLSDAVRISVEAEARFRPELGNDFSTYLRKRLLRLHRLFWDERQQIKIPGPSKEEREEEREREKAEAAGEPIQPIRYRGGNGTRITVDRQWTTNGSYYCRHRVVIGMQLQSGDEKYARDAIEQLSGALGKLLDDRPLAAIYGDIQDAIGDDADVRFYKGRKPPNFHKWPSGMVVVSFDQIVGRDEDENPLKYSDVIADGSTAAINAPGFYDDTDVDRLARAIRTEKPFLSPNERRVLAWKLDPRGGKLTHWAANNGLNKGYASRLNKGLEHKLAKHMKKN